MDALFGAVPHDEAMLKSGQMGAVISVKRMDDDDDKPIATAKVEKIRSQEQV